MGEAMGSGTRPGDGRNDREKELCEVAELEAPVSNSSKPTRPYTVARIYDALALSSNVGFAVLTVAANKRAMSGPHGVPPFTLTFLQYLGCCAFTVLQCVQSTDHEVDSLHVCREPRLFFQAWLQAATVGVLNWALMTNSVGFYQVTKLALVPVVVIFDFAFYRRAPSARCIGVLIVLCSGIVFATTASDAILTKQGAIAAALALPLNGLLKVEVSSRMREGMPAIVFLGRTMPVSAACLGALAVILENPAAAVITGLTDRIGGWLLVSVFAALGLQVSSSVVLGRTSALTSVLTSELKSCVILVVAAVFLDEALPPSRVLAGSCVALVAGVWYTMWNLVDQEAIAKARRAS